MHRVLPSIARVVFTLALLAGSAAAADRAGVTTAVFGPPVPSECGTTGSSVVLRRAASARAPVVGRVEIGPDGPRLQALSVRGSFVRVRAGALEGWASTRSAFPYGLAYAIDGRTGAIFGAVPFDARVEDAAFAPDGTRIAVVGGGLGASELRLPSLAPLRSIAATDGDGNPSEIRAAFYGGPDAALYVIVRDRENGCAVVRAREAGEPSTAPALDVPGTEVLVSGDRRVAFVFDVERDDAWVPKKVVVSVVDLRTLTVRGAYPLGDLAASFASHASSADGSELYLLGDVSRVRVLDASTGRERRQIATGLPPTAGAWLENRCGGGHAMLLVASSSPCDGVAVDGIWWLEGTRLVGAASAPLVYDDGARRTLLERPSADSELSVRIGGRRPILLPAPSLADGYEATPLAVVASPNGAWIVVTIGLGEQFCPC